jgi:hypothetical protein
MAVFWWLSWCVCSWGGCPTVDVQWLLSCAVMVVRWWPHVFAFAVVILWWLSSGGCPVVAVLWCLASGGCPVMAVLSWLFYGVNLLVVVLRWLSFEGCPLVAVVWWLSFGGCPMVASSCCPSCGNGPRVTALSFGFLSFGDCHVLAVLGLSCVSRWLLSLMSCHGSSAKLHGIFWYSTYIYNSI